MARKNKSFRKNKGKNSTTNQQQQNQVNPVDNNKEDCQIIESIENSSSTKTENNNEIVNKNVEEQENCPPTTATTTIGQVEEQQEQCVDNDSHEISTKTCCQSNAIVSVPPKNSQPDEKLIKFLPCNCDGEWPPIQWMTTATTRQERQQTNFYSILNIMDLLDKELLIIPLLQLPMELGGWIINFRLIHSLADDAAPGGGGLVLLGRIPHLQSNRQCPWNLSLNMNICLQFPLFNNDNEEKFLSFELKEEIILSKNVNPTWSWQIMTQSELPLKQLPVIRFAVLPKTSTTTTQAKSSGSLCRH